MNRFIQLILLPSAFILAAASLSAEVVVSNVRAEQRVGTNIVDVYYDVTGPELATVTVELNIRDRLETWGLEVPSASATGHIGSGVTMGDGRHVVWDAGEDWGDWKATYDMEFSVTATAEMPAGGDPTAAVWEDVNERWVRNHYVDGAITMSDRDTGLMWVYDAGANGTANWSGAQTRCNNLTYAGHSDWFLPNLDQLSAMYSQKAVFTNVQNTWYWSSSPSAISPASAMGVSMASGVVLIHGQGGSYWVWPCRGGQ